MAEEDKDKDKNAVEEGNVEEQVPAEPVLRKPSGLFSLIKAAALLLVLVVVEVVAASMLIPSAKETERLGRQFVAATQGGTAGEGSTETSEAAGNSEQEVREVELGLFNVTRYNPSTNTTLAIDFELYGSVLAADVPEFQRRFENSQARLREQIIMTLHAAEATNLTDAGLGLIKRQILEKTNRALGQPLIREVLFSKFNFVER
jgi:hypothetical protein